MPGSVPAIEIAGLRKAFGTHVVLDGIDLDVPTGTVAALLGPNGAGKTTMVTILATLLRPDGGHARVVGHDVVREAEAVRAAIGLTGQFAAVDGLLTGEENLRLMADLRHLGRLTGRRRVAELLEHFDLTDAARQPATTYSGGMRRRLDLAMTLVGEPRVVVLDEPTAGLDPRSRRAMWDIVRGLVGNGTTVLLTTQYLEEADQLADTVAILDQGHIVARGTPEELKRLVPGGHVRLRFADPAHLAAAAALLPGAVPDDEALALAVPGDGSAAGVRDLLGLLDARGVAVDDLAIETPDLDDVFLALTGRADPDRSPR